MIARPSRVGDLAGPLLGEFGGGTGAEAAVLALDRELAGLGVGVAGDHRAVGVGDDEVAVLVDRHAALFGLHREATVAVEVEIDVTAALRLDELLDAGLGGVPAGGERDGEPLRNGPSMIRVYVGWCSEYLP